VAAIKIASLNVGRLFHNNPKGSLGLLMSSEWDVICLQDVPSYVIEKPEFGRRWPVQHFAPMTKHLMGGARVPVGIGIFSTHPFQSTSAHAYVGNVLPVLDLDGVTVSSAGNAAPHDLTLVRATESRLAIFAEVAVGEVVFKIGTTHGVWVPGGKVDDHQRKSMARLHEIMQDQGGMVMMGDFNATRGGEIYDLIARGFIDCIPYTFKNSVDWVNRGKEGGPDLLVDHVFTDRFATYGVENVRLQFGVSDHAAIFATIRKD